MSDGYDKIRVNSCLIVRLLVKKPNSDILRSEWRVDKPYCDTLRSQLVADQVSPVFTDLLAPKYVPKLD